MQQMIFSEPVVIILVAFEKSLQGHHRKRIPKKQSSSLTKFLDDIVILFQEFLLIGKYNELTL